MELIRAYEVCKRTGMTKQSFNAKKRMYFFPKAKDDKGNPLYDWNEVKRICDMMRFSWQIQNRNWRSDKGGRPKK